MDMSSITSVFSASLESVKELALQMIALVIPYALPILGAIIVVRLGINLFKNISGAGGSDDGGSYSGGGGW